MGREDQGVAGGHHHYQVIPRTLCFITHGDDVLLLLGSAKKRLWAGRYNGLGGHVEPGEDIHTSVLREVREEADLELHNLRLRGVVHADAGDPVTGILFFVFTAEADSRDVRHSEEGALEWWPVNALPTTLLVEDLPLLLPKVLSMGPTDPPLFFRYSYDDANQLVIRFAESV